MHGLNTIGELNEAATKSREKKAWPDPVPAGEAKPVDSQPGSEPPVSLPGLVLRATILSEIKRERERQEAIGNTEEFDRTNSRNDWIAYVNAYTGRAAARVHRNECEGQDYRENLLKAAAILVAALEAHDKGYC